MRIILKVVGWALIIFSVFDYITFKVEEDQYVFGTEVAGWRYESAEHYIMFSLIVFIVGIIFVLVAKNKK